MKEFSEPAGLSDKGLFAGLVFANIKRRWIRKTKTGERKIKYFFGDLFIQALLKIRNWIKFTELIIFQIFHIAGSSGKEALKTGR